MTEALTGSPRLLNLLSPSCSLNEIGGVMTFQPGTNSNGWEIISTNDSTDLCAVWRGYIDLGGYEREQLTFFLQNASVIENQEVNGLIVTVAQQQAIDIIDCMSKVELTNEDLNHPYYYGTKIYSPGFLDSLQDMEQILWCRYRELYHDTSWSNSTLLSPATTKIWGEGQATAGSRIYCTRIVNLPAEAADIRIPQCTFNVIGTALEEADLEYVMRLRRDFELATQA